MNYRWAVACGTVALCGLVYLGSVGWRVGEAETRYFGRNHCLPLWRKQPDYSEPATADSYGAGTFEFTQNDGRKLRVYKQLINGFQHSYGSALVALELGDAASDFMFRANEYFEAYAKPSGKTYEHLLDTRKDLHNNKVGRRIAADAIALGLRGQAADDYVVSELLKAIDDGRIIKDFRSARVDLLPTPDEYGCPFLPHPEKTEVAYK